MDIHPQLSSLLNDLSAADYPDQTTVTPAEARQITDDRAKRFYGPYDEVASVTELMWKKVKFQILQPQPL